MSERHGLAAGAVPERPDWTIDQDWDAYSPEDHETWRCLFERQTRLLPDYACKAFVEGIKALPMGPDAIPDFRRVNDVLERRTGWTIVAVPGLVPDEVFFEHLANRRFPSGQFIRRPTQLDYLQEPDVFHDVFGHVPMLMHPVMGDFIAAYGRGGLRAIDMGCLPLLARVYWYTVEFGLVFEGEGLKLYGAGIASSSAESRFCIDDGSPNRIGFALERVMRTLYRIDDFQETYFVLDDLDRLLELADIDFAPVYKRVSRNPALQPNEIAPGDHLVHLGHGQYHRLKAMNPSYHQAWGHV